MVKRLLKDAETDEVTNAPWSETFPKRNKLLDPVEAISDSIRKVWEDIELVFGGKEPHETFKYFVNKDLKLKIIAETTRYNEQKNEYFWIEYSQCYSNV